MNPDKIHKNLLPNTATIGEVLHRLNDGVQGVVFLADSKNVVQGMFTDGDIRRAVLDGATLDQPAAGWMNQNFTRGLHTHSHDQNLALLNERIRHLPVLNEVGELVDLITWAELWRLPVMEPSLGGNELKYVSDCIASGWISSQGHYISRFSEAFQQYLDGIPSLCVSSGTTALHLALAALEIGPGDEVIVPDLTFAATANVVIHCGATPILADVDPRTWTLDPRQAESLITSRTKAIIPVHLYGHPCDMDPIMELSEKHGLKIIEDCAESLGAEYKGRKTGTIGHIGCFSFFANKMITTGEGGMVVSRDPELFERMTILRDHGMQKDRRYWHLYAGYNYRMTNLQAAIGLAQMEQLPRFVRQKLDVASCYQSTLASIPGIERPPQATWARNIYWLYSVRIHPEFGLSRDELSQRLLAEGIDSRPFFFPLHEQPPYRECLRSPSPNSLAISRSGLSLPSGIDLRPEDVDRVCAAIASARP